MLKINERLIVFSLLVVILLGACSNTPIPGSLPEVEFATSKAATEQPESVQPVSDASGWSPVGTNAELDSGAILEFAPDGTLYAGTSSILSDGNNVSNISRWNGQSWVPLGGEFSGKIHSFAIGASENLYASSIQDTNDEDGSVKEKIFKWDGSTWIPIGDVDGVVFCMLVDTNGYLYIGGYSMQIGEVEAVSVAKWDGLGWSAMGWESEDSSVQDMIMAPNGAIYAVGDNYLSRWDGVLWTPLQFGGDVYGNFRSIAMNQEGVLFVSGSYTKDGVYKNFIAKLEQSNWSFIDSKYVNSEGSPPTLLGFSKNGVLYGAMFDIVNIDQTKIFIWTDAQESDIPVGDKGVTAVFSPVENALYAFGSLDDTGEYGLIRLDLPNH